MCSELAVSLGVQAHATCRRQLTKKPIRFFPKPENETADIVLEEAAT